MSYGITFTDDGETAVAVTGFVYPDACTAITAAARALQLGDDTNAWLISKALGVPVDSHPDADECYRVVAAAIERETCDGEHGEQVGSVSARVVSRPPMPTA